MRLIIVIFFCLCSSTSLVAQEIGRLPDGRAFRTDMEGTQLVDYIAELEMNVAELNRKVIGLEDENSTIKGELERVKAGRSEQIAEKDLIKAKQPEPQFAAETKFESPVKVPSCVVPPAIDCNSQVAPANEKIVALQAELVQRQQELKDKTEQLSQLNIEQARIAASRTEAEKSLRSQVAQLEQQLVKVRNAKGFTSPKEHLLESDLRASLAPEGERTKAADSLKSRMQQEAQAILNKKDDRDLLFSKYIKERQGLTLKPSLLRAKSGRDIKQIEDLISKTDNIRELSLLKVDLEEIQKQMADDLALVERMSKLKAAEPKDSEAQILR